MSGLYLGYEDLNDQSELRRDVLLQTAAATSTPPSTPGRFSRCRSSACVANGRR